LKTQRQITAVITNKISFFCKMSNKLRKRNQDESWCIYFYWFEVFWL